MKKILLEEDLFLDIKKMSEIFNISCSEFMVRMSDVPYCDDEEEEELMGYLNSLSDDDLQIVRREIIKL